MRATSGFTSLDDRNDDAGDAEGAPIGAPSHCKKTVGAATRANDRSFYSMIEATTPATQKERL
jgi:hypothetical protein